MTRLDYNVGDIYPNSKYGDVLILEINNARDVLIRFLDTGYEKRVSIDNVKRQQVKDLYFPSHHGVGYLGEGEYYGESCGKKTMEYIKWQGMISRCYNIKDRCYSSYGERGVVVCKEWHDFQKFAGWCYKQPNFGKSGYALDKDAKGQKLKMYSPDTCAIIPEEINTILRVKRSDRGDYPSGVSYHKKSRKFTSYVSFRGEYVHLGYYDCPKETFYKYKDKKESLIKMLAEDGYNKGYIDIGVRDALFSWEVEMYP